MDFTGKNNSFFGRKHTRESKDKMSKSKKGKHYSPKTEFKNGHHPVNWSGGKERWLIKQCLRRDNNTCKVCGLCDPEIMMVDHIKPKAFFPHLRFILANLRAMCPNCHERKSRKEKGLAKIMAGKGSGDKP